MTEPTNDVEEATSEEAPVVVVPAAPTCVSEADLMKAENINLRLIVASNRETFAQQSLNDAVKERMARATEMQTFRSYLEEKYSINLTTHQINERTGLIVPRQ